MGDTAAISKEGNVDDVEDADDVEFAVKGGKKLVNNNRNGGGAHKQQLAKKVLKKEPSLLTPTLEPDKGVRAHSKEM